MCLRRKIAATLFVGTLLISCFSPDKTSAADAVASVVRGNVRFQVLSPSLVRMEYSPKSSFVDEASVAVVGRSDFSGVAPKTSEKDGWLMLSTGRMTVSYKLGSGPFSKDNLRIAWSDKSGTHDWKPGDRDAKNLGGVPGTLDNRSMVAVTDPGLLTRNGYYWLDDSRTALFDKPTDWVKPRSEKDSLDWYFFVYGNDFAGALKEMAQLTGPIPMLPRYVFGLWFGSRAAYSDEQWKMIVDRFREERLPVDMIVLDSLSGSKVVWGGYDHDLEQMPDLKGFLAWMKQRGIKATINEHYEPLTRVNDSHFDTIRKAMGMPENTEAIPHDIANKKYAALFMDLLPTPDLDEGMAFWWQDGCAGTNMEGLDPYLWTRHVEYLGSERITGKRTTAFCRLGTAVGSHRYGIFFTGDLTGIWESLPVVTAATIRGGNQLMPYMNNLCGGVHVANLPPELYQRCVQLSAFHPIASSSDFAMRCCRTLIHALESPTTRACRWCEECISTIPTRSKRLPAISSTCSAANCWLRRSRSRAAESLWIPMSSCRPATTGSTISPATSTKAAARSSTDARWIGCRCLRGPAQSFRPARRWTTAIKSPSIR